MTRATVVQSKKTYQLLFLFCFPQGFDPFFCCFANLAGLAGGCLPTNSLSRCEHSRPLVGSAEHNHGQDQHMVPEPPRQAQANQKALRGSFNDSAGE